MLGIVVGLAAEARIARRLSGRVAIGGGDAAGAVRAAAELIASGATALLSFGLAGGLDPRLRPGAILVPRAVRDAGLLRPSNPRLAGQFGGPTCDLLLAGASVVPEAAEKRRLYAETGAAAVDLETGAVAALAAAHQLPWAALRAVCDPAERSLPPAAAVALDHGGAIGLLRVLTSLGRQPGQLPDLLRLARDALVARRALLQHLRHLDRTAAAAPD